MTHQPLHMLPSGARARVVELDQSDRIQLQKLLSLGILPGSEITLVRRFPTLVLEVDRTRYALDQTLASRIRVAQS